MDQRGRQAVDSRRSHFLDSTLGVAGLTAFSYLIAYRFQIGGARAYGVPGTLVSLRLEYILAAAVGIISVLMGWWSVVTVAAFIGRRISSPRWTLVIEVLPMFLIISLFSLLRPAYLIAAGVGLLLVLFALIWPRTAGSLLEWRVKAIGEPLAHIRWLITMGLLLLIALILYDVSPSYGEWVALHRVGYPVLANQSEEVVLLQYGDMLICAPLMRPESAFLSVYTIYSLKRDGPLTLRMEAIGPLTRLDPPVP